MRNDNNDDNDPKRYNNDDIRTNNNNHVDKFKHDDRGPLWGRFLRNFGRLERL